MQRRPEDRYPGMVELRTALAGADLSRRATADATSVQASPPPPPPRFVESERRWLVPAVFVTIVALSLTLAAVLIGKSDAGQQIVRKAKEAVGADPAPTPTTTDAPQAALTGLTAEAFDPEGTAGEHDDAAPNLIDGDSSTVWDTEQYLDRTFGLKRGVGVYLSLPEQTDLESLVVDSPTNAWSATVYIADSPGSSLESWGQPVAQHGSMAPGQTTFDLDGRRGRYILLWITDLGDTAKTAIGELSVTAA
jgi:hypothetical protein